MVLLPNGPKSAGATFRPLFDSLETVIVATTRRRYEILLGHGFRYEIYRQNWINPVITKLYDQTVIPFGQCYMDIYR